MKNLSEYYNDNLVFSGSDIMLTEGFWSKLGNILGMARAYPTKLSKEFRDAYATAMYLGAQSDNEKLQSARQKQNRNVPTKKLQRPRRKAMRC